MSKKEILKPFDLDKAKNGAKVKTRDGHDVRILCYDRKNSDGYKILALVLKSGDNEIIEAYRCDGRYCRHTESDLDLQIVEYIEVPDKWRDRNERVCGYIIDTGEYEQVFSNFDNCSEPPLEEQADVVDAYAKLMQIIEHDTRFGGFITAEEWRNPDMPKSTLDRRGREIVRDTMFVSFRFLAFHKASQRDLFLKENEDLIKKFFML